MRSLAGRYPYLFDFLSCPLTRLNKGQKRQKQRLKITGNPDWLNERTFKLKLVIPTRNRTVIAQMAQGKHFRQHQRLPILHKTADTMTAYAHFMSGLSLKTQSPKYSTILIKSYR